MDRCLSGFFYLNHFYCFVLINKTEQFNYDKLLTKKLKRIENYIRDYFSEFCIYCNGVGTNLMLQNSHCFNRFCSVSLS